MSDDPQSDVEKLAACFERVAATVDGRALLGWIIFDRCAVLGSTFAQGGDRDSGLWLEGRRSIGTELANQMARSFPDMWLRMQQERRAQ